MIEVKDFSFRYREGTDFAVRDASLSVGPGRFLGITGAAGSGKSTLTYALNGVVPHCYPGDFYGSVTVGGLDTCETKLTEVSRIVGSVCQDIESQMVTAIVEDEVLFGLENFGIEPSEIEGRLSEALQSVGIADLRHRAISSLSGGQKQKVALASILALRPQVLVLDEPTSELDPVSSLSVFALLKRYAVERQACVVVVEQKIGLIAEFADELVVMDEGCVAMHGAPADLLAHPAALIDLGVNVPRSTELTGELARRGLYEGSVCRSVEEASYAVREVVACSNSGE